MLIKKGQTLIELLIIMALLAILLPVLLAGFTSSINGKASQEQQLKATALLKEAEEGIRTVRESGWNNIPASNPITTYHIESDGLTWQLVAGAANINGLNEGIIIDSAYRLNGTLVDQGTSGAQIDPSTKKFTITISWDTPLPRSISSTIYLVRLDNIAKTYSTHIDSADYLGFDPGIKSGTEVVDTTGTFADDAQIQLAAGGGGGDWCDPTKSITEVDLPKQGTANAISATEGKVFVGTGENASGVSFAKISLTTDQPQPTVTPSPYPIFNNYKTNGVYGEGDYAYLTTDTSHKQGVIIHLTEFTDPPINLTYKEVGVLDIGAGSVRGQSMFVANNMAYLTASDSKLYIFDITNKSSPELKNTGGLALGGVGKKILVSGNNYAYIAIDSTNSQLKIVDVGTPTAPEIKGNLNLNTGQKGIDIYINTSLSNPDTAYLATDYISGQNNFYKINVSNPQSPTVDGSSYSTNEMQPTGVTVVTGNIGIIVGTGGTYQYQVINLSTMTSCTPGLQYSTGVRGVSSVLQGNGYAYSYIITGDDNAELKIILGGGQGSGTYASSGTYYSPVFDNSTSTAYNRFFGNTYQPSLSTTLEMQVAVSNTDSSCDSGNFTYVGPDADINTRFTLTNGSFNGVIPYKTISSYINPGRYFCFKVYFETDNNNETPVLQDLSFNYSP